MATAILATRPWRTRVYGGYPGYYAPRGFQLYIGPARPYAAPYYPPLMKRGGPIADPMALLEA